MNKGELRTHFLALLNRSDCTDALANTFIDQSMGRILRTLRIPSMEKKQTYAISSVGGLYSIVLPADLIEAIDIYYDGIGLVRLPMHDMVANQKTGGLGSPQFFTREQGTFLLYPMPTTGTLFINYYGELPAVTSDSDSNSLTILAADAIIYTALSYAADYFLDERGALFDGKSVAFVNEIQEQADTAESSGGIQVMRPTVRFED
jgi:hypothetical protein|tara:strand:+ start:613 stop:1227 length:615 start_codon:yes stop_codon:yes gene_type:complete